jgi:HPt (histidine-containing phosphotransfer) domain-containing protein
MSAENNSNQSPSKLYDLQMIDKMCRGDQTKIAKMVAVFIGQTTDAIQEIMVAYSEKDFEKIEKLAHKIKPTLGYFGASVLEQEFITLESLIINKSEQSEIELKIELVNNLALTVVNEMKNDFDVKP